MHAWYTHALTHSHTRHTPRRIDVAIGGPTRTPSLSEDINASDEYACIITHSTTPCHDERLDPGIVYDCKQTLLFRFTFNNLPFAGSPRTQADLGRLFAKSCTSTGWRQCHRCILRLHDTRAGQRWRGSSARTMLVSHRIPDVETCPSRAGRCRSHRKAGRLAWKVSAAG
jgi:hypothetical protein